MSVTVRAEAPHIWRVSDMDTTWLHCLMLEMHGLAAGLDACVLREHPLKRDVLVKLDATACSLTGESLLTQATAQVAGRLRGLLAGATTSAGCCRVDGSHFWAYANLLRRALLTRVPVLACTELRITHCDVTRVPDEMLAHRFGQVALVADTLCAATGPGSVRVEGRPLLAGDLRLPPGVRLAGGNAGVTLVPLECGQVFAAELCLNWGTGQKHAKFAAVASPGYQPEVRLPLDEPAFSLARVALEREGFAVDVLGEVTHAQVPVRRERVCELLENTPGAAGLMQPTWVDVTWESLGQHSEAACLRLALEAVEAEIELVTRLLIAFLRA